MTSLERWKDPISFSPGRCKLQPDNLTLLLEARIFPFAMTSYYAIFMSVVWKLLSITKLIESQDATSQHKDPFAAHVALSSWRPSLVLEEVDHLLDEVHCEENTFQMTVQQNFFDDICNALRSSPEILLVTSHESCNERGDRKPYMFVLRVN